MNRLPNTELVLIPGGTLITATPEEGRALALAIARHTIHNIQPDLDALKTGRPGYSTNPDSLIAAGEFGKNPPRDLVYGAFVFALSAVVFLGVAFPFAGIVSWVERRVWARIQSRVGPNRVGPNGSLQWLADGVEERALGYAISKLVPAHLGEVKKRRLAEVDKVEREVRARLNREIVPEERLKIACHFGMIGAFQGRRRHHDFKKRLAPLRLGADACAEPGPEHGRREARGVASAGEARAEQRAATSLPV